ncbi:unnamed protein product [marine sediment metagenome]|uniref:DUF3303 domain-containing protein n=1 Tax=marine sediment metagenome TaxID=412755 RepID=X0YYI5_9ZZZZ
MIYMITVNYPNHKSVEIAKLYLKQPREIPYVKKWRIFNAYAGNDGVKQYHLIYTDKEKAEDAFMGIGKYFMPFNQIEGFRLQIESLLGVSDGYNLLGMKWE